MSTLEGVAKGLLPRLGCTHCFFKETGEALLEVLAQESSCLTVHVLLKTSVPMPAALDVQKLVPQSLGVTRGALAACRLGPAAFLFLKVG